MEAQLDEFVRDRAEERRTAVEANYRRLGHPFVTVPKPTASVRDLMNWERLEFDLNYRPPESQLTYEAWMSSHGCDRDWTVADEAARKKVRWEPCDVGYWFLSQAAVNCPHRMRSHEELTPDVCLLSLEEYAILYLTCSDLAGRRIDDITECLLRTSFGSGCLSACDLASKVHVSRHDAPYLKVPQRHVGGRRRMLLSSSLA